MTRLVLHHWYEDESRCNKNERHICPSCNSILSTSENNVWNHILPRWELQKALVKARSALLKELSNAYNYVGTVGLCYRGREEVEELKPLSEKRSYLRRQTELIIEQWNIELNDVKIEERGVIDDNWGIKLKKVNKQIADIDRMVCEVWNKKYKEWRDSGGVDRLRKKENNYNNRIEEYQKALQQLGVEVIKKKRLPIYIPSNLDSVR